ncbi:MAG TPA: hypothetical protein VHX39_06430, partial [Acetobacteraceae bacterium]|nr:hypothetical protein [Acetobacteraceae bacterium]
LTGGSGADTLNLTSSGAANLSGVSNFEAIDLAVGGNAVTIADKTLSGSAVTIQGGTGGNNTVNAGGTTKSSGKTLTYVAGNAIDKFTGGDETDAIKVSAAAIGGDTLTGGTATKNTLTLTTAGAANLAGVSNFATITLAKGGNQVTVTDHTLSGGNVTINHGAGGSNAVDASGDTASSGRTLTYVAGTGTDTFTGGGEKEVVKVTAAAVGGDTLTGGSAKTNTLTLTTAGTVNLGGVSNFETINLAAGNGTVTVTDATLSGGTVALNDSTSGNNTITVSDSAASAGTSLTYTAKTGTDSFTGGAENDTVVAGAGSSTFAAGTGSDFFVFTQSILPSQTINGFLVPSDHIVVYGIHQTGTGFDLGTADNGLNPTTDHAITAAIFTSNASGTFDAGNTKERFVYNTTNGQLTYGSQGSGSASTTVVATLTGTPAISSANILFLH